MPAMTATIRNLSSRPISAGHRRAARGRRARLRQRESGDRLPELLPRRDMGEADLADRLQIEQGQALGEELAIDDALAEAGNDPEADPARELVHRLADPAHVARLDMLHAVAEDDPVDAGAVGLGA